MIKGLPHVRTADGLMVPLTASKLDALVQLARWPDGCGSMPGVMNGGTLSAQVQFGLAERLSADPLGGQRYRINAAGLQVLDELGLSERAPQDQPVAASSGRAGASRTGKGKPK